MDPQELEKHLHRAKVLAYKGSDFIAIKKHFTSKSLKEEDLEIILDRTDDFIINYKLISTAKSKLLEKIMVNVFLSFFALFFTLLLVNEIRLIPMILGAIAITSIYRLIVNIKAYNQPKESFLKTDTQAWEDRAHRKRKKDMLK